MIEEEELRIDETPTNKNSRVSLKNPFQSPVKEKEKEAVKEEKKQTFGESYNGSLPYSDRLKERLDIPSLNGNLKFQRMKKAVDTFYKSSEHINTKTY
jgi:hypothetical protein